MEKESGSSLTPEVLSSGMERQAGIPNGRYTVRNRETGKHRTFRVRTEFFKASLSLPAGKRRVLSLLAGSDNSTDYKPFAFVHSKGIDVWKKYQSKAQRNGRAVGRGTISGELWFPDWSEHQKLACMLWVLATSGEMEPGGFVQKPRERLTLKRLPEHYELLVSANCLVCNTVLTHPDSIRRGYGPVCFEKIGEIFN